VTTRVLVVDDQPLVRAGLASVLGADPGLEVVGEASDGADALRLARAHRPDVVLMDVRMPVLDGLSATRSLLAENDDVRVIVLTTFDVDEYVFDALRSGASAFLLKDERPEAVVAAVHGVVAGHTLVTPAAIRRLVARCGRPSDPARLQGLTTRETEVLVLVAQGATNAEIARALVVEESTVKTHVGRLLSKLGARDRVQLVITAYEGGLV
jgi:DNA-binding NarL/FixJ family response regulator